MKPEKYFTYLLKINVGPKNISCLVRNKLKVPDVLLETIAKEIITKEINDSYSIGKHYRVQTSEQYLTRMLKQSSFDIEDLNEMQIYDLQLKFQNDVPLNRSEEEKEIQKQITKQKFYKEEDGKIKQTKETVE